MDSNKERIDRRAFLRLAGQGAIAAGLTTPIVSCAFDALDGAIQVGGQRATVVDIHGHCAIPEVTEVVRGTPLEREISAIRLLSPKRLQQMDARRIDTQVLSINEYWWYEADRELATDIVRVHDTGLSDWCAAHGDRFVPLSSVALQFPDLAAEQLEYAVKNLGSRGASIGGLVASEVPSGPDFDPFWSKAEELGVPVFVHPTGARGLISDGALSGKGDLGNIIGNPLETTVFLTRMIFDGTLDRFPALKICGAHGGGYLPSYLGRTEVTCDVRRNANCANEKRPSEYLRDQILVDTMVFSENGLKHLYEEMGAKQIIYGTDLPFNWPDTLALIIEADYLNDEEKIAMLGGNLMRLLNLS